MLSNSVEGYGKYRCVTKKLKTTETTGTGMETIKLMKQSLFSAIFHAFTEGAKYWLQWAGVPDSIYSRTENADEYSDDFQSRGFWVNYLAGGSSVMPKH